MTLHRQNAKEVQVATSHDAIDRREADRDDRTRRP